MAQIQCRYCADRRTINYEKGVRSTNLDGSPHFHDTPPSSTSTSTPTPTAETQVVPQRPENITITESVIRSENFDSGSAARQELNKNLTLDEKINNRDKKIEDAFDKKMDAYDWLSTKIEGLTNGIDTNTAAIVSQTLVLQSLVDVLKIRYGPVKDG